MADVTYQYTIATAFPNGAYNSVKLRSEIVAALGVSPTQGSDDGTTLTLYFAAAVNQTTLDAVIAAHDNESLLELKIRRAAEVDARTEELILEGFDSTIAAPKRFAMDDKAMGRYTQWWVARNETWTTYPIVINTYGNDQIQSLPNAGAVDSLFEEAMIAQRAIIDSGSDLKVAIRAATTKEAVNAIEDNR